MATFEEIGLALQMVQNLQGLRKDMRDNADIYIARSGAISATVIRQDATEYIRRLDWLQDVLDVPGDDAKLTAGLAAFGLSRTELLAIHTELRAAAVALNAALLTSGPLIVIAANAVKLAVASHRRIF